MFKKLLLILFAGLLIFGSVSGQVKISELTNAAAPQDSVMFVIVYDSSGTMVSRMIYWEDLVGALDDNSTLEINTAVDPPVIRVKDGGIVVAKLGAASVETAKIKDLNVTSGKLAANAVVAGKINTNAVEAGDLAAGAVDGEDVIADEVVNLDHLTQAAYDYIGSGGTVTNNPDDVTLETKAGATLGIREPINDDLYMADDKKFYFGTGGDSYFEYDEDGKDVVQYSGVDQNWNGYYVTRMQNIPNLAAKGPGLRFDGTDDKVSLGTSVHLDPGTGDFSITALIKNTGNDGAQNRIFDVYDAGTQDELVLMINNTGTLLFSFSENAVSDNCEGAPDIGADGKWHHVAGTLDRDNATGIKAYIDGNEITYSNQDDPSGNTGSVASTGTKYIGVEWGGSNYPFHGEIAHIRFWNLALDNTDAGDKAIINGAGVPFKYSGASQTEIITDSDNQDFTDGTINEWIVSTDGNGTCVYDAGPGAVKTAKITVGATPGSVTAGQLATSEMTTLIVGKRYRIKCNVYIPSANNNFSTIRILPTAMDVLDQSFTNANLATEDAWQEISSVFTTTADVTGAIQVQGYTTTAGDIIYFDDITVVQIGCVVQLEDGIDGKNLEWHDASGNGIDGAISGAKATNPQTIIYTNKEEPDADEILVSINKTVSGTEYTVYQMDEDGDVLIEGSGETTGPTFELENSNAGQGGAQLLFTKDSASPADNDILGGVYFKGDDDGGNPIILADIKGHSADVTDGDEAGKIDIRVVVDGVMRSMISIDGSGGGVALPTIIYNENSTDTNYRWVTDAEGNGLFLDGGNTCLGLGTATFHANSVKNIALAEGTAPGGATADQVYLWGQDDTGTAEMYVQDGGGNQLKISPHNAENEWEFFSRNIITGKIVQVNMEDLIEEVEYLSGKSFLTRTNMKLIEVSKDVAFEEYEEEVETWKAVDKKKALGREFNQKRVLLETRTIGDSTVYVFDRDSIPVYQLNDKTGEIDTIYKISYKTVLDLDSPKWTIKDDYRFDGRTGIFYEKCKQILVKTKLKSGIWKQGNKYFRHETSEEMLQRVG